MVCSLFNFDISNSAINNLSFNVLLSLRLYKFSCSHWTFSLCNCFNWSLHISKSFCWVLCWVLMFKFRLLEIQSCLEMKNENLWCLHLINKISFEGKFWLIFYQTNTSHTFCQQKKKRSSKFFISDRLGLFSNQRPMLKQCPWFIIMTLMAIKPIHLV